MWVLVVSHTFSDMHETKMKKNEHYLCEMILLTDKDVSTNEVSQFNMGGSKKHLLDTHHPHDMFYTHITSIWSGADSVLSKR